MRTHLANAPCVGTPLLSRLKSTSQSMTCTQVSQSIDNHSFSRLKSTKSVDGVPSQSIMRSSTDSGD